MCMPTLRQVRLMEFSPNEKYAVSYSAEEPRGPREKASLTLNIFDTFSGVPPRCVSYHLQCCSKQL